MDEYLDQFYPILSTLVHEYHRRIYLEESMMMDEDL